MQQPHVIFPFFGCEPLTLVIQSACRYEVGNITLHQFPDEEIVIKIDTNIRDRMVIFIASLDRPNAKLLPLIFAAETARSLGAAKVILIAPYLPYMRQDKVFEPGQGVTSEYFAKIISCYFDGLITIDPHLHRLKTLSSIYNIRVQTLHATDNIAGWILDNIQKPILIGPDSESMQWVEVIAQKANAPYLILQKKRTGDNNVEVSIPHIEQYRDYMPVLIDDIISTGKTMMDTIQHLQELKMSGPICIGVHAVFAANAYKRLLASGANRIITCNTLPHASNAIDIRQRP